MQPNSVYLKCVAVVESMTNPRTQLSTTLNYLEQAYKVGKITFKETLGLMEQAENKMKRFYECS